MVSVHLFVPYTIFSYTAGLNPIQIWYKSGVCKGCMIFTPFPLYGSSMLP